MGIDMRQAGWAVVFALASVFMAASANAQSWSRSWSAAAQGVFEGKDAEAVPATDLSIRQVVRMSSGGNRLRIRLSNELSDMAFPVDGASVALADKNGCIRTETIRPLTFSGSAHTRLAAHAPLVSDPVDLEVLPGALLSLTIYLPQGARGVTQHMRGWATSWLAQGNLTTASCMPEGMIDKRRFMVTGVDVENIAPHRTIVTLGDSITDGSSTTVDANRRWPDLLADRLRAAGMTNIGVANQGISGNRVLQDGNGPSALARFDRDVLSVPGVSHVLILEGVNDIGVATRDAKPLSAEEIIAGYRQFIARAHARGIKILLGTVLPAKGAGYWSDKAEAIRKTINQWILTSREADGIVDFASAIADSADPDRMAKAYDAGDALHPNDAGMQVLADAVDLQLLR